MSLYNNQIVGIQIEKQEANRLALDHKISYPMNPKDCFDFETPETMYEVKSCHDKIDNGYHEFMERLEGKAVVMRYLPNKQRNGRFFIPSQSHIDAKTRADESNKQMHYIFIIVDSIGDVIKRKEVDWAMVDQLLAKRKPRSNGDHYLDHKLIFGEQENN